MNRDRGEMKRQLRQWGIRRRVLGGAIQEINGIENETHGQLEQITLLKQSEICEDVGAHIVEDLRSASR